MRKGAVAAVAVAVVAALVAAAAADEAYRARVRKWREEREARLKKDDGWLTLAGLFWLKEGANRFGTDPAGEIVLPEGSAPARAGVFEFGGGTTTVRLEPGVRAQIGTKPIKGPTVIKADSTGAPDNVELGALSMYVIKRGDRYGVRLKDKNSPIRKSFTGLELVRGRRGLPGEARSAVPTRSRSRSRCRTSSARSTPCPARATPSSRWTGRRCTSTACSRSRRADGAVLHPPRPDERQGDLRGRALPLRGPAEAGQARPGLQRGLQPALRVHALRDLPAAAPPELAAGPGGGGRDVLRQGRALAPAEVIHGSSSTHARATRLRPPRLGGRRGGPSRPRPLPPRPLRRHPEEDGTGPGTLGRTGLKVSRLAQGTGTNGFGGTSNQVKLGIPVLAELLRAGVDQGLNFWDTADDYGASRPSRKR